MAQLRVKTRMNVSPNGKRKVYFGCHPDDFKYFEEISNDILKVEGNNCAIYYYVPGEAISDEERTESISNCSLYVCPVTRNFLYRKNASFEIELSFALKNRMKILPVVTEPGLEAEFSKKFGSVQCLVKKDGYDNTLQNLLKGTFYPDKLIRKIRDAFDGYIFLSYRKKDRESALKLMKRIHNLKKFRGIGIWFDDFLVPGEDFDESILTAIKNSLFVVVNVTPNLISEKNYVKTIEYPYAVENNIHVIPAETVPTDRKELKKQFENLGAVYENNEIIEALNEAYDKYVKKPKEETAERMYLLALAYYSGINVEINRDVGDMLMRRAAKKGYIEAMEYLLRNFIVEGEEKIEIIRKLKRKRWDDYLAERKTVNMTNYLNAVFHLADALSSEGKYEEALECYKEILKKSQYHSKSAFGKSYYYNAQRDMAKVYIAQGNKEKAEKLYKNMCRDIEEYPKRNEKVIKNLYNELLNQMASFYLKEGRTEEAKECYRKGIEATGEGLSNENKADLQMYSYHQYGHCYAVNGEYENAEKEFEKSLKLKKEYMAYHDGEREKKSYIVTLVYLSYVKFKLDKRQDFTAESKEIVACSEELLKISEGYISEHIENLKHLVNCFKQWNMMSEAAEICRKLVKLPLNDNDRLLYSLPENQPEPKKKSFFQRIADMKKKK